MGDGQWSHRSTSGRLEPPSLAATWDGDPAASSDLELAVWASVVGHPLGEHDDRIQEGALRALAWLELGGEITLRQTGARRGPEVVHEASAALLWVLQARAPRPAPVGRRGNTPCPHLTPGPVSPLRSRDRAQRGATWG